MKEKQEEKKNGGCSYMVYGTELERLWHIDIIYHKDKKGKYSVQVFPKQCQREGNENGEEKRGKGLSGGHPQVNELS